ncbi:hypothetical protein [Geomicrobium sp. JCM 19055]|nr:hypothetical protein [Geomicrobium sp. JCM 19055]
MTLDGLTEEQAEAELERINQERQSQFYAEPSIFNNLDVNRHDTAEE